MTNKIPMPEAPEGYEWVVHDEPVLPTGKTFLRVNVADWYELKPKKKTYDWSKTADYVWVYWGRQSSYLPKVELGDCSGLTVSKVWLPHFGGPCPFDPDASIVEVELRDAEAARDERIAGDFRWSHKGSLSDIIAVRFVRLADGYTWGDE